uniref:Complex I-B12 n=1 Tax=Heterorhabditis bacteriophora TaxID=37862 RepID=A0A1I7XKR7_HETBA
MSSLSRLPLSTFRVIRRQTSTHTNDTHVVWREVNRLAREGKWDSINNSPKLFLFGKDKKEAYAVYRAINQTSDMWSQSPYGQYFKLLWRIILALGTIKAGVLAYEFIVPENKRLHYKFREQHDHSHH